MEIKSILVIIIFLLSSTQAVPCAPQSQLADIFSGTLSLSLASTQNNTLAFTYQAYTLTTPRPYTSSSNLQYTFAIKDFQIENRSQMTYFDLLVLKTYQNSLIVHFIYEPNLWKLVGYSYLIGFREDLVMGIESYTRNQFKGIEKDTAKGGEKCRI